MFASLLKAVEPHLKAFSHRVISPWKGNHVVYSDLSKAYIPWGFLSQKKILEKVTPSRERADVVEKRAERLNLDTQEFLAGTEAAYRCITALFTARRNTFAATAPGTHSNSVRGTGEGEDVSVDARAGVRNGEENGAGVALGKQAGGIFPYTNFLDLAVASPEMSMFLNDVLESYWRQGLVPRLSVSDVSARLCRLGVRLGGISKNTNFLGSLSADEVKYHLTMGLLGPEGIVINELEGRAPQKVIADVCLTCDEEFSLEAETGQVVLSTSKGPQVHYVTLQSNIDEEGELEWQITNINDVIKPNFDYYFSRFGH